MDEENEKCANPECNCATSATNQYCGERCRRSSGKGECECGHADCG